MANKRFVWNIKGMMKDIGEAQFSNEYAFDITNMRLNGTHNSNELLSLVNEKGTIEVPYLNDDYVLGTPIGVIPIGDKMVLFSYFEGNTSINLITIKQGFAVPKLLADGEFGYTNDPNKFIDGFGVVENEHLWKVYFNYPGLPLRVLSFDPDNIQVVTDANQLNFSPSMTYSQSSTINITANKGGSGQFSTGTIQYAYRYYKYHGQASGLINLSNTEYIYGDPTKPAAYTVSINIDTLIDNSFPYDSIQIYCIQYTQLFAQPSVKLVYDGKLSSNIAIIDNGNIGSVVDPSLLGYFGAEEIYANDMEQKGGRMFIGGITLNNNKDKLLQLQSLILGNDVDDDTTSYANYKDIKTPFFMPNNYYRLGVQLMHKNGKWSDVLYINDKQAQDQPVVQGARGKVTVPNFSYKFPTHVDIEDYIAVRPVVVYPDANDRVVVCNAVACPTVYNVEQRNNGSSYAQSSWFWRPSGTSDELHRLNGQLAAFEDNAPLRNELPISNRYDNPFHVDAKMITLHSPDIEFGNVTAIDGSSINCRTIGKASITKFLVERNIESSTIPYSSDDASMALGFYNVDVSGDITNMAECNAPLAAPYWRSETKAQGEAGKIYGYMIYPWHQSGSITNDVAKDGNEASSVLYRNQTAIYRRAENKPLTSSDTTYNSIAQCRVSTNGSAYSIDNKIYTSNYNGSIAGNARIYRFETASGNYETQFDTHAITANGISHSPLMMTYSSTPHIVFNGDAAATLSTSGLPIMEVRRTNVDLSTLFGGRSDAALRNNHWSVAGDTVYFDKLGNHVVKWTVGDAFFSDYSCLKTYSPSLENTNQIVDILNVPIASYVNMNGRYDAFINSTKNIGQTPLTYNLINMACSNTQTLTNATTLDSRDDIKNYKNWVTWSEVKENGSSIDPWTNINFAASMEMDGVFGDVRSIYHYNDHLFVFQDKSVSRVNYNERVMMNTSDGVPVAIANSKAVDGYTSLSTVCGCQNKYCIAESPRGLFFVDHINNIPYRFDGGQTFDDVALSHGMKSWFKDYCKAITSTHFDMETNDIMYEMYHECMSFNTTLNTFVGLFPYDGNVKLNFNGEIIDFRHTIKKIPIEGGGYMPLDVAAPYRYRKGKYNFFYDETYPRQYSVELFVNDRGSISVDKIYNEISWDSDAYLDGEYINSTFDSLLVSTDYQAGESWLTTNSRDPKYRGTTLKKKFNIWRALIPRCIENRLYGRISDRMRGPWLKAKLSKNPSEDGNPNIKMKVHNIYVDYTE